MKPAQCPVCNLFNTKLMGMGGDEKHYCFTCKKEFTRLAF